MDKKLINSQLSNYNTYLMYKRQLLTLAENVFEFENLPEEIDVSYLNGTLLRNGAVAFFYDEVLKEVIALPFTNMGRRDVYGRPTKIEVMGQNGYHRVLEKNDFVIMYDNNGRYPLYADILQYAERMALNKRVIDINITNQKVARIWLAKTGKEKTVQDMMNRIDGMAEKVFAYDNINLDEISGILNPVPYVADKIDLHLEKEWNEFLRLIGVANLTEQKKERLITDELASSQGGTIASRYSRFQPRKKAVEEINKKFGLNIKVRYYDGIPSSEKESEVEENDISVLDSMVTN